MKLMMEFGHVHLYYIVNVISLAEVLEKIGNCLKAKWCDLYVFKIWNFRSR